MTSIPRRTLALGAVVLVLAAIALFLEQRRAARSSAALHVYFVGNSYTYVNDLPSVVEALGEASGTPIETARHVPGGATLRSQWEEGTAPATIASGHFDAVVVQGNSLEAFTAGQSFAPYAERFAKANRNAGARTIWYATWARRRTNADNVYADGRATPESMTTAIDDAYRSAANESGGTVARAGIAWQIALREHPDVELYDADGSHPSKAGTLLAACVVYFAITGKPAMLGRTVPLGLDRAVAVTLCAIAPRVACSDRGDACP